MAGTVAPTGRLVTGEELARLGDVVYRSVTDVRELTEGDQLPGDEVLPGFSAPVASLFED